MNIETLLKAGDLFDSLGREKEQEETRRFEIGDNPRIMEMFIKFECWMKGIVKRFGNGFEEVSEYREIEYERAVSILGSAAYSSSEISEFSMQLKKYENDEEFHSSGIFISALINASSEDNFSVVTHDLPSPMSYIGFHNTKRVLIKGNAGSKIGEEMESGEIKVNGNCRDDLGIGMFGGLIIIKGNAGDRIGNFAKAGLIVVEGNAGDQLGFKMGRWIGRDIKHAEVLVEGDAGDGVGFGLKGGIIYLNGNYKSLHEYIGRGQIYHKGERLRVRRIIR